MSVKFNPQDFSIVIVTYNRPEEIKRNFSYLVNLKSFPREIIVIDQSENNKTKLICKEYLADLPNLKYFHSKKPSIPIAKNLGVKKSSSKSKVIIFLDDDAYLGPNYMDEIVNYYNDIDGVNGIFGFDYEKFGGQEVKTIKQKMKFWFGKTVRRLFFLGYVGDNIFGVTSPYGANSTLSISNPVKAEWFPGTDPSYKRSILLQEKFDENFFWYSLGEDVDISYRINKKYGGLYIVPASISHLHPLKEDDENRKIRKIYMNQINHFYLFYKLMPEMYLKFIWNIFGITFLRTLALLQVNKFNKRYIELKFFLKSLIYSIKNKDKIKKGDLSIPYPSK